MEKKGQPTHKPGTKYRPQEFSIQEMPDPESVLTEEQKTWRRYSPSKPDAATPPADPTAQPPPPADAP